MSISWPVSIPNPDDIEEFTMRPKAIVAMSQSPFSGEQNVQAYPGQFWQADVKLTFLPTYAAERWNAFGLSLNGREGTFLMGDPNRRAPLGLADNSAFIVAFAAQSVDTLVGYTSQASVAPYLVAGDYVQLGTQATARLYKVLEDANTDGSGVCSLAIWPRLRSTPSSGETITLYNTVGNWRLIDNEWPWTESPTIYQSMGFTAMESLP